MPATARAKEPPVETLLLEERIRRRAYELYVLRGNQSGSEYDDWLQAEEEIRRAQEEAIDEASRVVPSQRPAGLLGIALIPSITTH
jgi:DUF2934 family protein